MAPLRDAGGFTVTEVVFAAPPMFSLTDLDLALVLCRLRLSIGNNPLLV